MSSGYSPVNGGRDGLEIASRSSGNCPYTFRKLPVCRLGIALRTNADAVWGNLDVKYILVFLGQVLLVVLDVHGLSCDLLYGLHWVVESCE